MKKSIAKGVPAAQFHETVCKPFNDPRREFLDLGWARILKDGESSNFLFRIEISKPRGQIVECLRQANGAVWVYEVKDEKRGEELDGAQIKVLRERIMNSPAYTQVTKKLALPKRQSA